MPSNLEEKYMFNIPLIVYLIVMGCLVILYVGKHFAHKALELATKEKKWPNKYWFTNVINSWTKAEGDEAINKAKSNYRAVNILVYGLTLLLLIILIIYGYF
jgi:uncharacterized integral membrane protein